MDIKTFKTITEETIRELSQALDGLDMARDNDCVTEEEYHTIVNRILAKELKQLDYLEAIQKILEE